MAQTHHRDSGKELTINNTTDEDGFLKIYGKNADALILGDSTHEGGDISIYRDASGNKQLFVDADAASNAKALDVYGGVVVQNYLTVGQTTLHTAAASLYVAGAGIWTTGNFWLDGQMHVGSTGILGVAHNQTTIPLNIGIYGTDSTNHSITLQIDANNIIEVKATGDGSGGIINKAIGLYGGTPATQHAAIADATDAATAITQLNLLLAANRAISLIAT